MNEDIIEALKVMFDDKQKFFQNHYLEPEKESTEKESKSTNDKSLNSQSKEGRFD